MINPNQTTVRMKYALVNCKLQEAQPGLAGICKGCGQSMVARCGKVKISHWAHKGKQMCDPWWENETEWHRTWKGQFPEECQEFVRYAENGEKHIADVYIDGGYVIEFQHSYIKSEERRAREDFYKAMIWIVNGARRSPDKDKFLGVLKSSTSLNSKVEVLRLPASVGECSLLVDWCDSEAPVFFDFGENMLWGLLPVTNEERYVVRIERNTLITSLHPASQEKKFRALLFGWMKLVLDSSQMSKKIAAPRNVPPRNTNYGPSRLRFRF